MDKRNNQAPPPYEAAVTGWTAPGYPPPQQGYPPQPGYPSQPGYPPMQGYPPSAPAPGYPPQGYPPQQDEAAQLHGGTPGGPKGPSAAMGHSAMLRNFMKNDSDVEAGGEAPTGFSSFSEKAVRLAFIRKVYGILMVQLAVTAAFIAAFMYLESLRTLTLRAPYLVWIAMGATFICLFAMMCFSDLRRKTPLNFIFLGFFTLCEGFLLGTVASVYEADAVLMAVGICAVVTLSLTIFAFQTKYDVTSCGGALCAMVVVLMFAGILLMFLPYNKYAMIGYGTAGALIFSMYIVYDTQMMMGGNHKYSISPEEYIFAALNLYLDIINLFLYILTIIGAAKSN